MATIVVILCPIPVILRNGVINPNIVDNELIERHLDKRFIINLRISYSCMQNYIEKEGSDDELINRLTLHNYNDRLEEKKSEYYSYQFC